MLEKKVRLTAFLFLIIGLVLKALAVIAYPVHWDTNYYLNGASNFIKRGELTFYMWRLGADTNIIAGGGTGYGVLILNYWFKIFGLSVTAGHVLMYLVGVINLIVLYYMVNRWWGGQVAGLAAAVYLALHGGFIAQFHVRMDALAVLAYLLVLWLHLHAVRTGKNWMHFAVGVGLILAAEVHILAVLYIGAISFYYLLEQVAAMREQRRWWVLTSSAYYFSGLLLAGIAYLLIHVVPNPEAYFTIARDCNSCDTVGPVRELTRYALLFYFHGEETLIFAVAAAAAYLRRGPSDRHCLTLIAGYLITVVVISPPPSQYYMNHMLPLMALAVGGFFMKGTDSKGALSRQRFWLGVAAAGALIFTQLGWLGLQSTAKETKPASVDYLLDYVPEDVVVMSITSYYKWILEYDNFLSYDSGERYGLTLRDEDYLTFWEREKPLVFVGDPGDDADLWTYFHAHNFREVRDDIWVAGELYDSITVDREVPEVDFTVGEANLNFNECTTLRWQVSNAAQILLNGDEVAAIGQSEVCPYTTTTYTLESYWAGSTISREITVEVE